MTIVSNSSQSQLQISGYYGEIWLDIAEKLDLDFEVFEGTTYGILQENGHWNGMVGMVYRNEVEIAVADFIATDSRKTAIDFALPTDEEE